MKTIGKLGIQFPETPEEAREWKPMTQHHALAMKVLAVAHTRIEGMWCAYIDAVPGERHDEEWYRVLDYGDKLSKKIASAIFPCFSDIPYAD